MENSIENKEVETVDKVISTEEVIGTAIGDVMGGLLNVMLHALVK